MASNELKVRYVIGSLNHLVMYVLYVNVERHMYVPVHITRLK